MTIIRISAEPGSSCRRFTTRKYGLHVHGVPDMVTYTLCLPCSRQAFAEYILANEAMSLKGFWR
jgi:hypothetical protein